MYRMSRRMFLLGSLDAATAAAAAAAAAALATSCKVEADMHQQQQQEQQHFQNGTSFLEIPPPPPSHPHLCVHHHNPVAKQVMPDSPPPPQHLADLLAASQAVVDATTSSLHQPDPVLPQQLSNGHHNHGHGHHHHHHHHSGRQPPSYVMTEPHLTGQQQQQQQQQQQSDLATSFELLSPVSLSAAVIPQLFLQTPPQPNAGGGTLAGQGEQMRCCECALEVRDAVYAVVDGRPYHSTCLRCERCQRELISSTAVSPAVQSCFLRDGRFYCAHDFHTFVRPNDLAYHLGCFSCVACGRRLTTGELYAMHGAHLFCHLHYQQLMASGLVQAGPGTPFGGGGNGIAPPTTVAVTSLPPQPAPPPLPPAAAATAVVVPPPSSSSNTSTPLSHLLVAPHTATGASSSSSSVSSSSTVLIAPLSSQAPSSASSSAIAAGRCFVSPLRRSDDDGLRTLQSDEPRSGMLAELADDEQQQHPLDPDLSQPGSQQSSGAAVGAGGRTKRMRTSFKHHQLRAMKCYFNLNHNPDAKDLKQLALKTGLTKRVLQVWFQNARAKFRRQHQQGLFGAQLISSAQGAILLDSTPSINPQPPSSAAAAAAAAAATAATAVEIAVAQYLQTQPPPV